MPVPADRRTMTSIKPGVDMCYSPEADLVAGLVVGIIGYIAYNHLVVKTDKAIYQMEANSVEFLDHLNEPV